MTPEIYLQREHDIFMAQEKFPGVEVGEAYRRYMEEQGRKPVSLSTADPSIQAMRETMKKEMERPCTQPGCSGNQVLEGVCGSCVEGRAGFKTKWTCSVCLHRDLSKKDITEWLKELSKG